MNINEMIEEIKKVISNGITYDQFLNGYIGLNYINKLKDNYELTLKDIRRMPNMLLINGETIKESLQEWEKMPCEQQDEQEKARKLVSKVILRNSKEINSEEKIFPNEKVIVNELALYCNQRSYDGIGYSLLTLDDQLKKSQISQLLYENNFTISVMNDSKKIHIGFQKGRDLLKVKVECPFQLMNNSGISYFPAIQSIVKFDINASSGVAKYENVAISYKIPKNFVGVDLGNNQECNFDASQCEYEEYDMPIYRSKLTAILSRILRSMNKIFGINSKNDNITTSNIEVNDDSDARKNSKNLFSSIKTFISQFFNRIFRRKTATATSNDNAVVENVNNSSLNNKNVDSNDEAMQNSVNNAMKVAKEKINEGIIYKHLLSEYIKKEDSTGSIENCKGTWTDLDRWPIFVNGQEISRQLLLNEKGEEKEGKLVKNSQERNYKEEVQKIFSEIIFQNSKISPSKEIIKELAMQCNQGSYYVLGYNLLSKKGKIAKLIELSNQGLRPLQFKDIASNRKISFNVLSSNHLQVESKGYYKLLCQDPEKCFSKIYYNIKFDINSSLGKIKYENIVISYKISKNIMDNSTEEYGFDDKNQPGEYEEFNMPVYHNVNESKDINNVLNNEDDVISIDSGVDIDGSSHNVVENKQEFMPNNSVKNDLDEICDQNSCVKSASIQQLGSVEENKEVK